MVILSETQRRSIITLAGLRASQTPQVTTQTITTKPTAPTLEEERAAEQVKIAQFISNNYAKLKSLGYTKAGKGSDAALQFLSANGFSDYAIRTNEYEPKVYGSPLRNQGAYEYTTDAGQRYIGTKDFIQGKMDRDAQANPMTGTITSVPAQKLNGVVAQDYVQQPTSDLTKIKEAYSPKNLVASAKDLANQFFSPRYFVQDVSAQTEKFVTPLATGFFAGVEKTGLYNTGDVVTLDYNTNDTIKSPQQIGTAIGKTAGAIAGGGLFFTPVAPYLIAGGVGEGTVTALGKTPEQKEFKSYIDSFQKRETPQGIVYENAQGQISEKEYQKMQRDYTVSKVLGGVEAVGSSLYIGSKVNSFVNKKVVLDTINPMTGRKAKTFQLEQTRISQPKDVLIDFNGGQLGTTGQTVTRPASYQYQTTKLNMLLGKIPEPTPVVSSSNYLIVKGVKGMGVIYSKQGTDITGEMVSRTVNKPIYFRTKATATGQAKGNVLYPSIVEGESKEMVGDFYSGLKKYEKQLVGNPLITKGKEKYYMEYTTATSLGKLTKKGNVVTLTLPKAGTTTTKGQAFTTTYPYYETSDANMYLFSKNARTLSENPQRLYNVQKITGASKVYKEPFTLSEPSNMISGSTKTQSVTSVTTPISTGSQVLRTATPTTLSQINAQKSVALFVPIPKASVSTLKSSTAFATASTLLSASQVLQTPLAKAIPKQTPTQTTEFRTIQRTTPTAINIPRTRALPDTLFAPSLKEIAIPITTPSTITTPRLTLPKGITTPRETPIKKFDFSKLSEKKKARMRTIAQLGYKAFTYVKGKKTYIGDISTRIGAIKIGEKNVLNTVSARFGIEKTRGNIYIPEGIIPPYTPNAQTFRNYKIRGNRRIPLQDEWIQKAGTRLGRRTEVRDLLSYRKRIDGRLLF